jgi:hypothetical protein
MERNWQESNAGWRIVGMIFGCLMLTLFTVMSSKGASSAIQQPIEPEIFSKALGELNRRSGKSSSAEVLFSLQGFTPQGIRFIQ